MDFTNHRVESANSFDGGPLLNSLDFRKVEPLAHEPLVLGAVPIKSELIREVQYCADFCDVFNTVIGQWKAVTEALRLARRVVVVGYSFPKEDHYGRFLIEAGLRERRSEKLAIEFFELEDKASERMREIADAFDGHYAHIAYRGPIT